MTDSRLVTLPCSPDLSTWTQYKGGASTITLSGTNNVQAELVNDGSRCFLYKDIAVSDTDWIYFSAEIVSADAVFDTDGFGDAQLVTVETGVQAGDQLYEITSADDGNRVGVLFQPYAGATTVRLRVGPGAATTGEAGTLTVKEATVQQFASEPTYVDKYYDVSNAPAFPHEIYTDTDAQSTYLAGAVTEVAPTARASHDLSRILCIGDSYGLTARYPDKVIADLDTALSPNVHHLFRDHVGGTNLTDINARVSAALTGAAFDIPAELQTPFKAVVLGTVGGNSVLDGHSSSTILSDLDAFISTVTADGTDNLVLVGVPPFKGYPSWTQGKQDVASAVRTALSNMYSGCPVVDTFALLESPNAPEYLADDAAHGDPYDYANNSSSPDDGDGLHANWVPAVNGHQVLADNIVTLLQATALVADNLESASELSTPTISQEHALSANDVESAAEVSAPVVGQVHNLMSAGIESTSEASTAAVGQVHSLLASDVESASENNSPVLGQAHALSANDVQSASELAAPTLSEVSSTHNLLASDVQSLSEASAPALGQVHALTPVGLESSSESSEPTIAQIHVLTSNDSESVGEVSSPALSEAHALTANDAESTAGFSSVALGQIHSLAANDAESISELSIPVLAQVHILYAEGVEGASELAYPRLSGDAVITPEGRMYLIGVSGRLMEAVMPDRLMAVDLSDRNLSVS